MKRRRDLDDEDQDELRDLILEELDQSHHDWESEDPPLLIRRNQFSLTPAMREAAQWTGLKSGCHTCNSHIETDSNQPWIGDHNPPTKLSVRARVAFQIDDRITLLFPQCDVCSGKQSALVNKLNGKSTKQLEAYTWKSDEEKALIMGGKPRKPRYCISSTGDKVSAAEGLQIQRLGTQNGCHSCDSRVPRFIYHADHIVPQEFCTSYMEQIFRRLDLDYPAEFELRPQCPRCSGAQGGRMSRISVLALNLADQTGETQYKRQKR